MNRTSVSVVVPAFRAVDHLRQAVDSVRGLRFRAECLELLIVDDGSGDGTAELARELVADLPFRSQVITQANGGPSSARNAGWRRAAGNWIQFLDVDDVLHPDKLEVQTSSPHVNDPDVSCIYSQWERRSVSGQVAVFAPQVRDDPVLELLRTENFVPVASGLIRKSVLDEVCGFDEDHRFIEDVDLELRIAMAGGKFRFVPSAEPLFSYRQHRRSLSMSSRVEFAKGCARNARAAERFWMERSSNLSPAQKALLLEIYTNALSAFGETDMPDFDDMLAHIRSLCPGFLPAEPRLRLASRVLGTRRAYQLRRLVLSIAGLRRAS